MSVNMKKEKLLVSNYTERKVQYDGFFQKLNDYFTPKTHDEIIFDFSKYKEAKPKRITINVSIANDKSK
jgi:hypothetical protein